MTNFNFFNYCSSLFGSWNKDLTYDCRFTVGSPSGRYCSSLLKLITVLVLVLTLGVGNVWGASESMSTDLAKSSWSSANSTRTWSMTSCTVVHSQGSGQSAPNYSYPGRWYKDNVVTFTPGADYSITKIVLVGTSSYKGQTMTSSTGSISTNSSTYTSTWTGPSKSAFTITMGAQFRFGSVTIHYCYNPKSLTNLTFGSTTATLSWTDTHNVGSYEVYYSTSGTTPAANQTPSTTVSEKSVDLTGLTASTQYYWWVRSKCADDCKSVWIAGPSFTTKAASKTLSSIAITNAPTTTKYLVGETFSKTGAVVTATYSDATTANVSASATWTPTTGLVAGSNTITASYTEGGVTRTATTSVTAYSVTVQKQDEDGTTIADAGVTASATGRTLSASGGSTNYVFKQWKFGTASGTSIASSSSASTSLTGTPTAAVTVIAEFYKPIPVSWNKNGSLYETTYTGYNQKPVFPDAPSSCDATSNTFYGWATSTWENTVDNLAGKTVYTSASAMPNVTATGTVYNAVFAKASSGGGGEPTEKFSVDVQAAVGDISLPSGYSLSQATEWKSSTHRQDGSNDPAYIKIYHTSTKLFSSLPAAITIKAELYGGTARDMTSDGSSYYPYVFFTDNAGNEIAGSAKAICTSVTTSAAEKSVSMTVSDATNAYGIGIRHAKISGFNLRYSSITLEYAEDATTYSKYLTTCCTALGSINSSFFEAKFLKRLFLFSESLFGPFGALGKPNQKTAFPFFGELPFT